MSDGKNDEQKDDEKKAETGDDPRSLASLGGAARAAKLTPDQRSEIAKKAAEERWAKVAGLPLETHTGVLRVGDGIGCSVLDTGKRVFSVSGLVRAFGMGAKGRAPLPDGALVPPVMAAANIRPYIADELYEKMAAPISYRSMHGGRPGLGYEADILNLMCDALLDARAAGVLRKPQMRAAYAAEVLTRAFAKVGVIALIDEATGYQADRASDELQRLVAAYVVEDMRPYVGLFPDRFFKLIYKLHGWQYKEGVTQGPRYVGKFINDYIYQGLPDVVLGKLRQRNPVINRKYQRRHKHFQFLTEEIGEPALDRRLASVMTLISVSTNKQHFNQMFRTAFPKPGEQLTLGSILEPAPLTDGQVESLKATEVEPPALAPKPAVPGEVEITAGVRESILAALRGGNAVSTHDLAMAAYGNDDNGAVGYTRNKLRKMLARLKAEGIVETPSPGIWRLSKK